MIFEKYNNNLKNKCGMPKRKSKLTEELQQKYPFFRKGRDEFDAECITYGYATFVFVNAEKEITHDGNNLIILHQCSSKAVLQNMHLCSVSFKGSVRGPRRFFVYY